MLALVALLAVAPEASVPLSIDVPLVLGDEIDEDILATALAEVDAIFAPGNINLRFELASGEIQNPTLTVLLLPRPATKVIAGCSRDKHDHRLGHTSFPARRVTIWSEQIVRAVDGDWDRREIPHVSKKVYARALGRVLAHELGHLFLRMNGHRDNGLMRPSFSHSSLTARSNRAFRMSSRDLDRMRVALERVEKSKTSPPKGRGRSLTHPMEAAPTDETSAPSP